MKNKLFIALLIIVITACDKQEEISLDSDIPVLEAYLIPGKMIGNIKLTKLIPYSTEDEDLVLETINDAEIKIIGNNSVYYLVPSVDSGYYHCPDNSAIIEEDTEYSIEFLYNDKIVTARTLSPSKPNNFAISTSSIYFERVIEGSMPTFSNDTYEITWDNLDDRFYYLTIELIESTPDPINFNMESDPEKMISSPMQTDVYNLTTKMIKYFGTYMVVLYKVNQEYVNLYEDISQNSISMTEPLTNIENGKGIFTSFTTDTLYFEVKEW